MCHLGLSQTFKKGRDRSSRFGGKIKASKLLLKPLFKENLIFDFFYSDLQKAVEVMCILPKRCNDMMNVGRLQGFDVGSYSNTSEIHLHNKIRVKMIVNNKNQE